MKSLQLSFTALYLAVFVFQGCNAQSRPTLTNDLIVSSQTASTDYLTLRKNYKTVLQKRGAAPQESEGEKPPRGTNTVFYNSGNLKLKGWLTMPKGASSAKTPAVVFFHGGFALGAGDLESCQPFLDNGFAVFTPALRGENNNPGNFELFYGEVEDARAAVHWIARQPKIDDSRIYVFGHSVGGGIAALLSLWDDVPVKMGGSSGGMYSSAIFEDWTEILPFDAANQTERNLRLLKGNISAMRTPHVGYIGIKDYGEIQDAASFRAEAKSSNAPLTIKILEGDHFESLAPAIADFAALIKANR